LRIIIKIKFLFFFCNILLGHVDVVDIDIEVAINQTNSNNNIEIYNEKNQNCTIKNNDDLNKAVYCSQLDQTFDIATTATTTTEEKDDNNTLIQTNINQNEKSNPTENENLILKTNDNNNNNNNNNMNTSAEKTIKEQVLFDKLIEDVGLNYDDVEEIEDKDKIDDKKAAPIPLKRTTIAARGVKSLKQVPSSTSSSSITIKKTNLPSTDSSIKHKKTVTNIKSSNIPTSLPTSNSSMNRHLPISSNAASTVGAAGSLINKASLSSSSASKISNNNQTKEIQPKERITKINRPTKLINSSHLPINILAESRRLGKMFLIFLYLNEMLVVLLLFFF
jgi:hypothetical protein